MTLPIIRQLQPHAPCPAHMRIAHDWAVMDEARDPSVTAICVAPRWSPRAMAAFNEMAHASRKEFILFDAQDIGGKNKSAVVMNRLESFIPELIPQAAESVLEEVIDAHVNFFRLVLQHGRPRVGATKFMRGAEIERHHYILDPENPKCLAHADQGDQGLFTFPIGTILVDQTGLDHSQAKLSDSLAFKVLPYELVKDRLWQVPDGSFVFTRGGKGPEAQFHLFPDAPLHVSRMKSFVYA